MKKLINGKSLELFEEWYINQCKRLNAWVGFESKEDIIKDFNKISFLSMQWGVYQDFFDSQGMQIYIKPNSDNTWSVYIDHFGHHILTDYLYKETRKEARESALEKANEILNERLK